MHQKNPARRLMLQTTKKNKAKIIFVEADIIHSLVILPGLGENECRSIADLLGPDKTIRRFPYKDSHYSGRSFEGSRALIEVAASGAGSLTCLGNVIISVARY
jgi:hypothetical protein